MAASADNRVHERFGANVRIRRLRAGLTQDQLAVTIGLSRTSVANIEQGRQQVLLHHAWAIARTLGVATIDELIGLAEPASELRKVSFPEDMNPAYAEWARLVVGEQK